MSLYNLSVTEHKSIQDYMDLDSVEEILKRNKNTTKKELHKILESCNTEDDFKNKKINLYTDKEKFHFIDSTRRVEFKKSNFIETYIDSDDLVFYCDKKKAKYKRIEKEIEWETVNEVDTSNKNLISNYPTYLSMYGSGKISEKELIESIKEYNHLPYVVEEGESTILNRFNAICTVTVSKDKNNNTLRKYKFRIQLFVCEICGELVDPSYNNSARIVETLRRDLFFNENSIKCNMLIVDIIYTKNLALFCYYDSGTVFKKDTKVTYEYKNQHKFGSKSLFKKRPAKFYNNSYLDNLDSMNLVIAKYLETSSMQYNYVVKDLAHAEGTPLYISSLHRIYLTFYIKNVFKIESTYLASFLLKIRRKDKNTYNRLRGKSEKEILKILNLNSKNLLNIYNKNIDGRFISLYLLCYKHIKNKDSINKLIEDNHYNRYFDLNRDFKECYDLVKEFFNNKNETILINSILKHPTEFLDTLNMIGALKENELDFTIDYTKSILNIHNEASIAFHKHSNENLEIPTEEFILNSFEGVKFNDLTLKAAKETQELFVAGSMMSICVGSYSSLAVQKDCFIVIGYNKDNYPELCIELRKNGDKYAVVQVKEKFNNNLSNENKIKFKDLLNSLDIENDCYDLKERAELNVR